MSPKHFQRFRHEKIVEFLAVHKDKATGKLYTSLDDIKHTYPDALQFKVDGKELEFMRDANERMYEAKWIAHHPDDIIDVICMNSVSVPLTLPSSKNYELHEYPIPRLFVIMPEPTSKWDPTNLLGRKYRLHFLCECCDHRQPSSKQRAAPLDRDARFKNRVHLTDHQGYELSRPTEFFEQYGAFLLSTLRILKHCMEPATAVAPVAGLVHDGVGSVVREVSPSADPHLESINSSIGFLKGTLEEHQVNMELRQDCDADSQMSDAESQQSDHLQTIAALDDADLCRLHTFLWRNDEDKVLGDLYRVTTDLGRVKWVCLKHYKDQYRTARIPSIIQSVEAANGHYDRHFRKVTVTLISTIAAKDFFKRLISQGSTVNELHVTLAWNFWSSDLVYFVGMIAQTNIEVLHLDFDDGEGSHVPLEVLRLSRGLYYPLLDLLLNRKLRALHFANLSLFGSRTPDLSSTHMAPSLRSFHFFGAIRLEDDNRLASVVSSCQGLVDLRLGSGSHSGHLGQKLHLAIHSLKHLQSLHLQCMYRSFDLDETKPAAIATSRTMKEIVGSTVVFDGRLLEETVQRSLSMLEVLVLESHNLYQHHFAMFPQPKLGFEGPMPYELPSLGVYSATTVFSRLTHIDLFVRLTTHSLNTLKAVLPHLRLIHFGSVHYIQDLLKHVNFVPLKSLSIGITRDTDLGPLQDAFIINSLPCQIDSLKIEYYRQVDFRYPQILHFIPLTRLHLSRVDDEQHLCQILESINFSRLEDLSIYECKYSKKAEAILTRRRDEFLENLTVQLDDCSIWHYSQDMAYVGYLGALKTRLPEKWVQHLGHVHRDEIHYRFLRPILPVTYY